MRRLDREERHDREKRDALPAPAEEHHQDERRDCAPTDRRQLEERQHREDDNPRDRAEDVEPVSLERCEAPELLCNAVTDRRHHGDGEEKRRAEAHPARQRRPAEGAARCSGLELDVGREEQHEADGESEHDRRPPEEIGAAIGAQEAEPDPEEAPEQHEVRQVREMDVVGRGPADQRKLDEEHQETETDEPHPRDRVDVLLLDGAFEGDGGYGAAGYRARSTAAEVSDSRLWRLLREAIAASAAAGRASHPERRPRSFRAPTHRRPRRRC